MNNFATGYAYWNKLYYWPVGFPTVEPIDWECKRCGHSWKKHRNGLCNKGIFSKCGCNQFILDQEQIKEAEKEIKELEEKLFEDYREMEELLK